MGQPAPGELHQGRGDAEPKDLNPRAVFATPGVDTLHEQAVRTADVEERTGLVDRANDATTEALPILGVPAKSRLLLGGDPLQVAGLELGLLATEITVRRRHTQGCRTSIPPALNSRPP